MPVTYCFSVPSSHATHLVILQTINANKFKKCIIFHKQHFQSLSQKHQSSLREEPSQGTASNKGGENNTSAIMSID